MCSLRLRVRLAALSNSRLLFSIAITSLHLLRVVTIIGSMDKHIEAGKKAIDDLGGISEAAKKISAAIGFAVAANRVKQWPRRGIAKRFAPTVAALVGVSAANLDPSHIHEITLPVVRVVAKKKK